MRLAVIACMAGGCFSKPPAPTALGPDAAVDPDAAPLAHCSSVRFPSDPTSMFGSFGGMLVGDPTMTDDQLELYFTRDPTQGSSRYDIQRVMRGAKTGAFVLGPDPLPFNMPDVVDTDSSITGDGLMIAFVSQRPDQRVYVATRTSRGDAWSSASLMPGLQDVAVYSIDLANDGLDLYFSDGSGMLYQASRQTRTDAFVVSAAPVFSTGTFPSVSSDGLELFISGNSEIVVAQRASKTVEFLASGPPLLNAADPDVSPDGETLLAVLGGNVAVYHRVCP